MPDRYEVRVESDRETNATQLVSYITSAHKSRERMDMVVPGLTKLTLFKAALKLFADRHQLYPGPKIWAYGLRHTKCPATTIDIPSVLPNWLETLLE